MGLVHEGQGDVLEVGEHRAADVEDHALRQPRGHPVVEKAGGGGGQRHGPEQEQAAFQQRDVVGHRRVDREADRPRNADAGERGHQHRALGAEHQQPVRLQIGQEASDDPGVEGGEDRLVVNRAEVGLAGRGRGALGVVDEGAHSARLRNPAVQARLRNGITPRAERLQGEKVGVFTALGDELCVCSAFDDATLFQNEDLVGVHQRGQTVGDNDRGLGRGRLGERLADPRLSHRIDGGGGVVEDHNPGTRRDAARDRHPLTLPTR